MASMTNEAALYIYIYIHTYMCVYIYIYICQFVCIHIFSCYTICYRYVILDSVENAKQKRGRIRQLALEHSIIIIIINMYIYIYMYIYVYLSLSIIYMYIYTCIHNIREVVPPKGRDNHTILQQNMLNYDMIHVYHICICILCICMYVCVYIYIYIYTHTHITHNII